MATAASTSDKDKYTLFISYCQGTQQIAENLKGRLQDLGILAWVYSCDRLLGKEVWAEIENRIDQVRAFVFLVSDETIKSQGQKKELEMALNKVEEKAPLKLLPLAVGDVHFSSFPAPLDRTNGAKLDGQNVQTVAAEIARRYFPEFVDKWKNALWHYPIPGQWLEVCGLGSALEEHFRLGDRVYFRRLSPMGLFECYAPQIRGLFWFAPENLRPTEMHGASNEVPREFQILAMIRKEER
jgi:hypothetical protein